MFLIQRQKEEFEDIPPPNNDSLIILSPPAVEKGNPFVWLQRELRSRSPK